MLHRTAVVNLVALTEDQLKDMPRLAGLLKSGARARLQPTLPAVTCTSQTTMLTGATPTDHGIVGNGWHDRDRAETRFWQQSNRLVQAEPVWTALRRSHPEFTCANCFWWYAMYADVDVTITPRPMYPADGRKIPDIWTQPAELRDTLQSTLGQFPLFRFWGPTADITSSQWIAESAMHVDREFDPTLLLVYLPHLDYGLQKYGPTDPRMVAERQALDTVVPDLVESLMARGRRILLVNEYGIGNVSGTAAPNIALRRRGHLAIRHECGRELLDAGASAAFAVPDHQIAHVYVADSAKVPTIAEELRALNGVSEVLVGDARSQAGLDHERAGEIILVSEPDRWFCHDWWTDPARAPDYQRTVDIHRKPGYDPRELFLDPAIRFPKTSVMWRLVKKRLGFRTLMDVIATDPSLVRGSHGRCDPELDPILWTSESVALSPRIAMTDVSALIESLVTSDHRTHASG